MNRLTSTPWGLAVARVAAVGVLLVIWQLIVAAGLLPSMVPDVGEIASAIVTAITSSPFWVGLGRTLLAALAGWAIASVAGIVLGLLIGSTRWLDKSSTILVDFGRSFPVLALMPVVIMLLGSNTQMEIVVVALSCLWPILVQTIYGAKRQDQAVVDTVAVFRIPAGLHFRRVLLPAAMPFVATGLRIAASISILVAVGVEVLSQAPGIGRQITIAQQTNRWDLAFAYLIFMGLVGWGLSEGLQFGEKRMLKWKRQNNG